jgi:hypothetical protein
MNSPESSKDCGGVSASPAIAHGNSRAPPTICGL